MKKFPLPGGAATVEERKRWIDSVIGNAQLRELVTPVGLSTHIGRQLLLADKVQPENANERELSQSADAFASRVKELRGVDAVGMPLPEESRASAFLLRFAHRTSQFMERSRTHTVTDLKEKARLTRLEVSNTRALHAGATAGLNSYIWVSLASVWWLSCSPRRRRCRRSCSWLRRRRARWRARPRATPPLALAIPTTRTSRLRLAS